MSFWKVEWKKNGYKFLIILLKGLETRIFHFRLIGFSVNLDNIGNPDSAFPSAVSKTLEGMQANTQNPFWMFQISAFPFQNSVIEAIKYLRYLAKTSSKRGFWLYEMGRRHQMIYCITLSKNRRRIRRLKWMTWWTISLQFLLQVWKQNLMFRCVVCLFLLNIHIIIELILNIRSLRSRENTLSFYITLIRYLHLSDKCTLFSLHNLCL